MPVISIPGCLLISEISAFSFDSRIALGYKFCSAELISCDSVVDSLAFFVSFPSKSKIELSILFLFCVD